MVTIAAYFKISGRWTSYSWLRMVMLWVPLTVPAELEAVTVMSLVPVVIQLKTTVWVSPRTAVIGGQPVACHRYVIGSEEVSGVTRAVKA